MCLYSKLGENKKYKANKKNRGVIPPIFDERVKWVAYGCGNCIECRKKKSREWQVRLLEDIKTNTHGLFITLTFSNESYKELAEDVNNNVLYKGKRIKCKRDLKGYILDNEIAKRAVRLFNERWRKKYKKAIRHWLVTEIGGNGVEGIHLHGIVWLNMDKIIAYKEIERIWNYGHIWPKEVESIKRSYVNEATVTYICKYVSKMDAKHKYYKSIILTSAGIGNGYIKKSDSKQNKYIENETDETYRTRTGNKISLPVYWRNKIYTEEEREKLWIEKLNKEERWVMGERIDVKNGFEEYNKLVEHYRKINKQLGYRTNEKNLIQEEYEREMRIIKQITRFKKAKK